MNKELLIFSLCLKPTRVLANMWTKGRNVGGEALPPDLAT